MAENTKHTPGPWELCDSHPKRACLYVRNGEGSELASLFGAPSDPDFTENGVYRKDDERVANGKLMAAAPELLEALQGVLRVADRATDEFDAARAAIAKATGAT